MKWSKLVLLLLVFSFVLPSCSTTPKATKIYDESIPLEKSAWLNLWNAGDIINYNGIPVNWKFNVSGFAKSDTVQIPAGDTLLTWNVKSRNGNKFYIGEDFLLRYNFLPEKQYVFLADVERGRAGFHVYIYDIGEKIGFSDVYSPEFSTGFFPFLNTEGRTLLE